jgi:hypothetical protein
MGIMPPLPISSSKDSRKDIRNLFIFLNSLSLREIKWQRWDKEYSNG